MSVTITIVVDDTGTEVSTQAAGAPGAVAASPGHVEADAAPPTLVGGPEGGAAVASSGFADDPPPLALAALGLGADTSHGGGGGPPPADVLVEADQSDTGEGGGPPMLLAELGEAPQSSARRPARGK